MNLANVSFLICDDSILSRKKLKDFVKAFGSTEIYEAADGINAVDMYKEYKPDIVFMDIIMPKKEGVDALKEILEINPDAKVVMASSVGTQSYLKKAIELGASNFLQKPIDFVQIEKILNGLL